MHCKHGKTELVYCAHCHVERLTEERNKLVKALEWYGDKFNYELLDAGYGPEIKNDEGRRARNTLSEIKGRGMKQMDNIAAVNPDGTLETPQDTINRLITNRDECVSHIIALKQEIEQLKADNAELTAFYDYWAELYGTSLEIVNWHQNGDKEAYDNFFDEAESCIAKLGGTTHD